MASNSFVGESFFFPGDSARVPDPPAPPDSTPSRPLCACGSKAASTPSPSPSGACSGNMHHSSRLIATHTPVSLSPASAEDATLFPWSNTRAPSTAEPACPNLGSVSDSGSNLPHSAVGK